MQHFTLNGQTREVGNKAVIKALRKQGLVPCNLYGLGMENVLFTVSEKELKGLTHTPASHIVDVVLDGDKKFTAVLHEIQYHPVQDNALHVDFLAVNEEKPISINVPVTVSGHSVGVMKGGKFVLNSRSLRVCGLMKDLPDTLPVDISKLDVGQKIQAGDLQFEGVTVTTEKNTVVCSVRATRNSSK